MKEERPLICALKTDTQDIYLNSGQTIYETPKTYEIWQRQPLRFVARIRKVKVFFILVMEEWLSV